MTELYQNSANVEVTVPSYSAYNDQQFTQLVSAELGGVSNGDDFYRKLIELRNEQKKSLQFMEDLYNQKHQLKEELIRNEPALLKNGGAVAYLTPQAVAESYKFNLNSMSAYEPPSSVNHLTQSALAAHNLQSSHNSQSSILNTNVTSGRHSAIRVNTSKPPLPTKVNSTVTFQDSVTVNNITRDEDDYEGSMLSGGERRGLYDTIQSDMRHIERIWSDFKFEDSKSVDFNRKFERRVVKKSPANRAGARRSESLKRRPASASLEWIPRVTVPEPFSMTLREGVKNEKTLKAFQETREEREARAEAELRECKRQFKANPAPAHITLPLYEKIKMEEELRKMRLKKASQEYMERVARPFNLTEPKRGGSVKERRHSFTEGDQQDTAFYAQPLPEYYFNEDLTQEKMKEEELYKQIKNRMRAAELLNQSKLPKNMKLNEQKKLLEHERELFFVKEMNQLARERAAASASQSAARRNKMRMNKSHDVPDHDAMYKRFVMELETHKARNRKHTKIEPFNLLTEERFRRDDEDNASRQSDLHSRPSSASSFTRSYKNLLASSQDAMPIKLTETQKLRESFNKGKLNDMTRRELQQEHIEKIKKMKEKKLHDQIQEKIKYDPKEIDKNFERETRKKRLEQRSREEEYEKELESMKSGLQGRKLQIEQSEEKNLKQTLEKKYQEALRRAGLSETDLRHSKKTYQVAKELKINNTDMNDDWINQ